MAFVVFIFVLIAILGAAAGMSGRNSGDVPASTAAREKLDINHSYQTNLVYDELGWIDTSKVSRNLREFYDKTGIQPALALFDYIPGVTGNESAGKDYASNWYDENIDGEGALLLAYLDTGTEEEGWAYLIYGDAVKSVMDAEAEDIFWAYYDRYWTDTSVDLTDAYPAIFNKTAERIMQQTTTSADVMQTVMKVVLVVAACGAVIFIMKTKRKHDAERAEETERILNANLRDEAEHDPLLDRYSDD